MFGGPVYFYQNLVYSTTTGGPLKYLDTPAGILCYQNTFVGQGRMVGPVSNVHFLDNLFVGDNWSGAVFSLRTYTNYSTSDYNGFRPNPEVETAFEWNSPAFGTAADYRGALVTRRFKSLEEYREATGQERHSILVDYGIFVKAAAPDPSDPQRLYTPGDFDFRLKPDAAAVDAGVALPSINDGFSGRAPDLGAFELDHPVPQYGPRSEAAGSAAGLN